MIEFTALENPFEPGRWVACRSITNGTWLTAVSSHNSRESAEREVHRLRAQYEAAINTKPFDPNAPQQMVLGFYSDEQP